MTTSVESECKRPVLPRFTAAVVLVAVLVIAGCDRGGQASGDGSGAPSSGDPAGGRSAAGGAANTPTEPSAPEPVDDPLFGVIDAAAELAALQGTWTVAPHLGARNPESWVVDGDQVTITDEEGESNTGTLAYVAPGHLTVEVQQGSARMTSHYAYARDGDDIYIGLGSGGAVEDGRYFLRLTSGYLVGDGTTCRFHTEERGFDVTYDTEGVPVPCAVTTEGETSVLTYSYPDRFDEGRMREGRVTVIGEALVNTQLQGHRISRAP